MHKTILLYLFNFNTSPVLKSRIDRMSDFEIDESFLLNYKILITYNILIKIGVRNANTAVEKDKCPDLNGYFFFITFQINAVIISLGIGASTRAE